MNKGFTLLFAVLVTSVALVVGVGVFDVVLRQIELSGVGRESQAAFYAADTGIECGLYWDVKESVFGTTSPPVVVPDCLGGPVQDVVFTGGATTFTVTLQNDSCAAVRVAKEGGATTILARGFNVGCDSDSPRKVERALEATY